MLGVFQKTTRVINIDETEVDKFDFRRRCWQRRDTTNSNPVKKVRPRVTMIAALDSHGQVYVSLL